MPLAFSIGVAGLLPLHQQPIAKLRMTADGIEIWRTRFSVAGMVVPQHAHEFDHLSMVSAGAVRVWADGKDKGIYRAPEGIMIRAHVKHRFDILEDGTIVDCIHNVSRTGEIQIAERHEIAASAAGGV